MTEDSNIFNLLRYPVDDRFLPEDLERIPESIMLAWVDLHPMCWLVRYDSENNNNILYNVLSANLNQMDDFERRKHLAQLKQLLIESDVTV